jgi:hypothetical protein
MSADEMSVDKMSDDKLSVDKMQCSPNQSKRYKKNSGFFKQKGKLGIVKTSSLKLTIFQTTATFYCQT